MKKLLAIALITGALSACGSNENREINRGADSTNVTPASPDTSMMNTDTTRMNTDTGARTNPQ